MTDPLKGQRRSIMNGKARICQWPHDGPCPVKVGQILTVGRSCAIEITRVRESLKPGKEPLWLAEFIRHEREKVYLLRASPPAHADQEERRELDADQIRKAAAESAYTSSPYAAIAGEPESVGPDWKDVGRVAREAQRQEATRASIERQEAAIDRTAATVKQVGRTLGRNGVDLTDALDDIVKRLARAERDAA